MRGKKNPSSVESVGAAVEPKLVFGAMLFHSNSSTEVVNGCIAANVHLATQNTPVHSAFFFVKLVFVSSSVNDVSSARVGALL